MSGSSVKFVPEPERYEFSAGPMHHFELARRDFFKFLGAGIAVFAVAKDTLARQETAPTQGFHPEEIPKDITAWLHIGEDGKVTAFTGKVEIGQNIRTSLAQTVADELRVPFESVTMVTADTALTPFDFGTVGSRSMPTMSPQLRRVASKDLQRQTARLPIQRQAARFAMGSWPVARPWRKISRWKIPSLRPINGRLRANPSRKRMRARSLPANTSTLPISGGRGYSTAKSSARRPLERRSLLTMRRLRKP
jgi:CO/xanthine dehydrogenase Mo-binding subunit